MNNDIEKDSLRELRKIERDLGEIKHRALNPRRLFVNGMLYGAGAFVGGALAIALVGWILSILGIIPGMSDLVDYLKALIDNLPSRGFR